MPFDNIKLWPVEITANSHEAHCDREIDHHIRPCQPSFLNSSHTDLTAFLLQFCIVQIIKYKKSCDGLFYSLAVKPFTSLSFELEKTSSCKKMFE